MLGATKPSDSAPGTIRGDFALDVGRYYELHVCLYIPLMIFK
jgi:nucleoside diphosphate kinase